MNETPNFKKPNGSIASAIVQKFVRFGDNKISNTTGTENTGKEEPKFTQMPIQQLSFSIQQA